MDRVVQIPAVEKRIQRYVRQGYEVGDALFLVAQEARREGNLDLYDRLTYVRGVLTGDEGSNGG